MWPQSPYIPSRLIRFGWKKDSQIRGLTVNIEVGPNIAPGRSRLVRGRRKHVQRSPNPHVSIVSDLIALLAIGESGGGKGSATRVTLAFSAFELLPSFLRIDLPGVESGGGAWRRATNEGNLPPRARSVGCLISRCVQRELRRVHTSPHSPLRCFGSNAIGPGHDCVEHVAPDTCRARRKRPRSKSCQGVRYSLCRLQGQGQETRRTM